jgi:hypothetical protein
MFFRLRVGQVVLFLPRDAGVRDYRSPLCVAVRNGYQNIRHLETNELGLSMLFMFRSDVPRLQLLSQLH